VVRPLIVVEALEAPLRKDVVNEVVEVERCVVAQPLLVYLWPGPLVPIRVGLYAVALRMSRSPWNFVAAVLE